MKPCCTPFTLFALLLFSVSVWASGDSTTLKVGSRFGEKSAVTDFNPEEGFKMSADSLQTLGVRFKKLEEKEPWTISKDAVVRIKHTSGVYRRFEGWISFVIVKSTSKKEGVISIQSEDLQPGDEIAVEGALFLRMTEADLNSDTVDSCSH